MHIYPVFHKASKGIRTDIKDEKNWPLEWTKPLYKKYHGAPRHDLPKDTDTFEYKTVDIREVLLNRKTCRNFAKDAPIALRELGCMLALACGETNIEIPGLDGKMRRPYPSGGALFPVEVYVFLNTDGAHLQPGLYHYCPDVHALEELDTDCGAGALSGMFVYPWMHDAPVAIFLTAVFQRAADKYHDRGYRFALLEVGHVAQNLALVVESLGLAGAEGGTRDERVDTFLDIDGVSEGLVSSFLVGKPLR